MVDVANADRQLFGPTHIHLFISKDCEKPGFLKSVVLNEDFHVRKLLKLPSSLSPVQLPLSATFIFDRLIITSRMERRALRFTLTFSAYALLRTE